MKPNSLFPIICAAFALLSFQTTSRADALLTLTDSSSPFDSISINPGDTFSVNVNLATTTEQVSGFSYLFSVSIAGSGSFSLTSRDITGAPYSVGDLTNTNAVVLSAPNALFDPTTNSDLGATIVTPIAAGSNFIAQFAIASTIGVAPGTYTISFNTASVFDENVNEIPLTTGSYTVTVIPEPTTALLLAGSLTAMMLLRRRRAS
jgi:hypothetical protein